jgi:hypothetical protein
MEKEANNKLKSIEDIWKLEIEEMLKNPQTKEDFNAIGRKLNQAIDNNYNGDVIWDYQIDAAKKRAKVCDNWDKVAGNMIEANNYKECKREVA